MSNDLLIQINADTKGVKTAFDDVKSQTEDLEGALSGIAKISGVAFAALSAQVAVSLRAFGEAETATKRLTQSLQDQGIFTTQLRDQYKDYAEQVSKVTGIQADEITSAQAVAQSFLGQVPVTKELTQAIADLAVKQGISLPSAAEELGKAIGNGTGMLLRQGLQFSATDSEADRYAKTLEFVSTTSGGFAASANTGLGSIKGLQTAFHDAEEELGARFAPAATTVIKLLTDFLTPAKDSTGALTDLKAVLITVGLAISSLGVALPLLSTAFLTARAAALAFGVSLSLTGVGAIVVGIGVLTAALTELALHWTQVSNAVKAAVADMGSFIAKTFSGIGAVITGVMTGSIQSIKDGVAQIQAAFSGMGKAASDGWNQVTVATQKGQEVQNQQSKAFADKRAAQKRQEDADRKALATAEHQAIALEEAGASQQLIEIHKKYVEHAKTNYNQS